MSSFFLNRYERLGEKINPEEIELKQAIRVNTLKIKEAELIKRLKDKEVNLEKIPFLDFGYYADAEFALSSTQEHLQGYFYIQEAASQLPPQIMDLMELGKEGLILDMTASPGGKTTQISQVMKNEGKIVALESESNRLSKLRNNVERMGVKNCIIYHKNSLYCKDLGLSFDRVLLDAPCSGNFSDDSKWFEKMEERGIEGVRNNSELQKKLLKAAFNVLKPGGILVYSTCSLEPEENELNINWLLEEFEERAELMDTGLKVGDEGLTEISEKKLNPEIKKTRRFWPNKTGTQGFFIAKIKKI